MRTFTLLSLMCASIWTSGCASSFMKTSAMVLSAPANAIASARREKPVAKILCLWEPSEGQGLDGKPSRGFAGQIIFFTHGDPSPIRVNKTVRIYQYSDFDADELSPEPIHVFTFEANAFNAHRADGTLGEAYNVFLPYVIKTTGHVVAALRVEIETEHGHISSPYTEVTLARKTVRKAGSAVRRNIIASSQIGGETHNSTATSDSEASQPPRKLESTTIKLPSRAR